MNWQRQTESLDERVVRARWLRAGEAASFQDVLTAWREDAEFVEDFVDAMVQAPWTAYFWETPALTRAGLQRPFECVWVRADTLAGCAPEPGVFAEHFGAEGSVARFDNLGGDAVLVAPTPTADSADYAHLAGFSRRAPHEQQRLLWKTVADAALERLGEQPLWISTSGLGVYWLHVRLDRRPKYYTFAPYRELPLPNQLR